MIICETARLRLRYLAPDTDAAFLLRLLNDPSFLQNIGDRGVRTLDDAQRFMRDGPLASYAKHGFGLFVVELRDTRVPIGLCGLLKRDWLPDPDVGYAFLPEFWANGYAYESAAGVMEWGRTSRGLTRIVGITKPGNAGSQRVLIKLGLQPAGTVHSPEGDASSLFAPPENTV